MRTLRLSFFTLCINPFCHETASRIFILLAMILPVHLADAATQPKVYFAGVSYLGEERYIKDNYPIVYQLNSPEKGQQAPLDKALLDILNKADLPFTIVTNQKGLYLDGQAIALTLAIERESYSAEYLTRSINVFGEVSAQLLFFDFNTMHLIKNIPVDIARNDVLKKGANIKSAAKRVITELYVAPANVQSLLDLAVEQLKTVKLTPENAIRFQIDEVTFSDKAKAFLSADQNTEFLSQVFGQYFTAQLNHLTGLNMIPYIHGYAIRNKMSARMANNEVYQLTLPEPDYLFSLEISDFIKMPKPEKSKVIYGSRVKVSSREAMTQEVLFNEYMHYAVNKLVLKSHTNVDDWSGYEDATEVLLSDIAEQMADPERDWFKVHSTNKASTYKQLKKWNQQFYEK